VRSDYTAMLDACVLLPMPLADTLLRMAESPRLYLPKWSDEALAEVTRNLVSKMEQEGGASKASLGSTPQAFSRSPGDGV
jgi:hypothetical protein